MMHTPFRGRFIGNAGGLFLAIWSLGCAATRPSKFDALTKPEVVTFCRDRTDSRTAAEIADETAFRLENDFGYYNAIRVTAESFALHAVFCRSSFWSGTARVAMPIGRFSISTHESSSAELMFSPCFIDSKRAQSLSDWNSEADRIVTGRNDVRLALDQTLHHAELPKGIRDKTLDDFRASHRRSALEIIGCE